MEAAGHFLRYLKKRKCFLSKPRTMIDERTVFLYTEKEALAQFSCWFQERHTLRESKGGNRSRSVG